MTVVDEIARDFLLERFDDYLAVEQGAAGTTSEAYHCDLSRFVTYARDQGRRGAHGRDPRHAA